MIEGFWHWNVTERKLGIGNDCIGRNENWLDGKIHFMSANQALLCKFLQAIFHIFTHLSSQSDLRHQACKKKGVFARLRGAKGCDLHRKWPHVIGWKWWINKWVRAEALQLDLSKNNFSEWDWNLDSNELIEFVKSFLHQIFSLCRATKSTAVSDNWLVLSCNFCFF